MIRAELVHVKGRTIHLSNLPKPEGMESSDLPTEMYIEIRYKESDEFGRAQQGIVLDNVVIPRIVDALNGTPR